MATMLVTTGMRSARRAVGAATRHQRFAIRNVPLQMRSAVAVFPMSSGSSASSPLFMQLKLMSTTKAAATSEQDEDDDQTDATPAQPQEPVLVYEGPMSRAVRLMKGVSVTSCILTSIGMPTLCLISEQSTSMVGKWAMCGTIMLFGLGTTSLFHVLFKPYVMRMWLTNGERTQLVADPELTVETLTLFAQLTKHHFKLSDASPPPAGSMHPMLSFQAKGKSFFVHPEVFEDRDFAEKLIGKKITAPRKDDDDDEDDE